MEFNFYFLIMCSCVHLSFSLNSAVLEFSDSTSKFTVDLYKVSIYVLNSK